MDLIYTNERREDVGVLLAYELDLSFGANENDFALKVGSRDHVCRAGDYICAYGTEYGGIIDAVTIDTASAEVTYTGRTWHGILNAKVLQPDAGQDYLIVSGDANAILASLVTRCGLDGLFSVSPEASGVTFEEYKMPRYVSAYDGIRKMLKSVNAKLLLTYTASGVVLSAAPAVDHTESGVDSDLVDFEAKQAQGKVNHLICLGGGELKDRTVLHLYADADGNITRTQTFFGVEEYAQTYDYGSAEDEVELEKYGKERLKELRQQESLSVSINDTANLYDVGDTVSAYDSMTGLSVAVTIEQKIVTIKDGKAEVSYSTDTQSTSVSAGTSTGETGDGTTSGLAAYPVGSVYLSVTDTDPATLFGGTWERLKDLFLLAAGDTYAAGATGGEATHALSASELPSHAHTLPGHTFNWGTGIDNTVYAKDAVATSGTVTGNRLYTMQSSWNKSSNTGSGAAHNNMPPYLAVYMWKRTA